MASPDKSSRFRLQNVVFALAIGMAYLPDVPARAHQADSPPLPPDQPIADPIPEEAVASDLALTLTEVVQFPRSTSVPPPTDPRLMRWARINYLGEVPDDSGRLYVPDLNGKLYLVKGGVPREYLDVGAQVGANFWSSRGLGSGFGFVAFHPKFADNGLFYTAHSEARDALTTQVPTFPGQPNPSHHGVLTEWKADDPAADTFTGTRRELMRVAFRTFIHGFQQIAFNPHVWPDDREFGLLYIAVGDGGIGPAGTDQQNLAMPHGKLLRIDPLGTNAPGGRYGIPRKNPFVHTAGALGEIYAYGLRNPHRFSWDDGWRTRMFVGNIGEHNIESIYEVKAGDNFGWTEREGPFLVKDADPTCSVYPLPADDRKNGYVYPVIAYDHDPPAGFPRCQDTGDAVIGGFVYRGRRLKALRGKYLFGDDVNGRLFYAEVSEMRRGKRRATIFEPALFDASGRRVTMQDLAGNARVDLRFGQDDDGDIYVLAKANGKIWKVTGARWLDDCDPTEHTKQRTTEHPKQP